MKYKLVKTNRFQKDYALAIKRGLDISLLDGVIIMLANGQSLPARYKDHPLKGDHAGYRECHIQPDWLLVYRMEKDILVIVLPKMGRHGELFKKRG